MRKLLLPMFFLISCQLFSQSANFLIPYREGTKWGFCDTLGRVKINPQFSRVNFFIAHPTNNDASFALVEKIKDNKTVKSVIDVKGNTIVSSLIGNVEHFIYLNNFYFIISDEKGKKGLLLGRKILFQPTFSFIKPTINNRIKIGLNNKFGLVKASGEILIPPQFEKITCSQKLSNQKQVVWLAKKGNEKVKFIDKLEVEKLEITSEEKDEDEVNELRSLEEEKSKKEKAGLIKEVKIEISTTNFVHDSTIEKAAKKRIDSLEQMLVALKTKFELDSIRRLDYNPKFYYVEKKGQQGFIDDSVKIFLLSKKYQIVNIYTNSTTAWMYKDFSSLVFFTYSQKDKFGIVNEFEDEIFAPEYDYIKNWSYEKNILIYSKNKKNGMFINNSLYKPLKPKYKNISFFKALKVKNDWQFNIFEIKNDVNETIGFIGENSIEYFKN